MLRLTITSVAFTLAIATSGCAGERSGEEPSTAHDGSIAVFEEESIAVEDVEPVAGVEVITVEDKIAQICDIPAPSFTFDSHDLASEVEPALESLAACLTTGGLEGETIILVGHADERGGKRYNLSLGQRRAAAVADYLTARGVDASRVIATTRGELDAKGTDPQTWAEDRRVDIMLRK